MIRARSGHVSDIQSGNRFKICPNLESIIFIILHASPPLRIKSALRTPFSASFYVDGEHLPGVSSFLESCRAKYIAELAILLCASIQMIVGLPITEARLWEYSGLFSRKTNERL